MRIEGTLSKWNDDRGFGFITPTQGGQEIFVHISAFPKDGVRPTVGERLTFDIETDSNGKKRAKNLVCPERRTVKRRPPATSRRSASYYRKERPSIFARAAPLLVAVALAVYGYGEYTRRAAPLTVITSKQGPQVSSEVFTCDGRTYCSQMTSCTEAMFFLHNCPNVQMDGDNDGVPCEQQWCTSPLEKSGWPP